MTPEKSWYKKELPSYWFMWKNPQTGPHEMIRTYEITIAEKSYEK